MLDYLKTYLGIHSAVTIYDDKINDLKEIAMQDLTIAGVSTDETHPLVKSYVATFVRLELKTEPSKVFIDSSEQRLQRLIEQLTYGVEV